ncbi:MAG: alpha-L-fucosidase [Dyella sp.]|uniref:alpha-L-fucosidase n=1 Tax=Dyella sp. TaxID=1869338 RepID=UPI003F819E01
MKPLIRSISLSLMLASLCAHAAQTKPPASPHPVPAIQDTETPAQRDARMGWWRQARFGMFIHWGLYAVPAGNWHGKPIDGIGEWIMYNAKIPVAEYKKLAPQFDPVKFDAHAWVALAKAAGMKYIIITAKHHDGFAMFDSKANPFNIVDATPFKRDPLKELAAEAQKQGIKFGFYYSQDQDWTAPGGAAMVVDALHNGHWDKAQDGDFAEYLHTKAIPQLKELLSNYQPAAPSVIWFDTPTPEMTPQLASEIVTLLNQHPNLIWNNRLGGGYQGDTETPEQNVPAQGYPDRDWETCMTINDTWGYKSNDTNFKSSQELIRTLVDVASKGGNLLLNVGPDAHGVIPAAEAERLQTIGKWLDVNGESIYGTGPTPFPGEHGTFSRTEKTVGENKPKWIPAWDWRATARPGKIYIHLLTWPGKSFHLANATANIRKAYLLADPRHTPLKYTQKGHVLDVQLPARALDANDTVIVLETT